MSKSNSICCQCQTQFTYDDNHGKGRFCSKSCYQLYKKNPIVGATNRDCVICGQSFLHYQDKVVTCSKQCSKKYGRITRRRSQIKSKINRKQIILDMHNNKCSHCGFNGGPRTLCFHHINPSTKLFELTPTNLDNHTYDEVINECNKCILLCHNCHCILHDLEDSKLKSRQSKVYLKYKTIKEKFIIDKSSSCLSCGLKYDKCLSLMTFHHRTPSEKSFAICKYNILSKSLDELESEVSKCDLLCMNCHMTVEDKISKNT